MARKRSSHAEVMARVSPGQQLSCVRDRRRVTNNVIFIGSDIMRHFWCVEMTTTLSFLLHASTSFAIRRASRQTDRSTNRRPTATLPRRQNDTYMPLRRRRRRPQAAARSSAPVRVHRARASLRLSLLARRPPFFPLLINSSMTSASERTATACLPACPPACARACCSYVDNGRL